MAKPLAKLVKLITPKRTWFQFRLRTLLMATAVLSVWLSIQFYRERITLENLSRLRQLTHIEDDVWEITWSPDGSRVAMLGWEKPVKIRESITLLHLDTIGSGRKLIHFAFSPNRDIVACCENGATAEIINVKTGETILLKTKNRQPELEFSPDGQFLATSGYGTEAGLWDVATGKRVRSFNTGQVDGGLGITFSPDGTILAVGNRNSTTVLFDVVSGRQLQVLAKEMSHELKFHPSGKTLAVAYVDGNVGLWDVPTGKLIQMRQTGAEEVYRVDWSSDGGILVTAGLNGDIAFWSAADLSLLRRLPAPEWVIGVKFTPDGSRLIVAGGTSMPGKRQVQVWGVPSPLQRLFDGFRE